MPIDRLILADDLSGAIDSAACFAHPSVRVRAYFDAARARRSDILAVDLGTRDRSGGEVHSALTAARDLVAEAAFTFKKVDSLLRGPWAPEIAYLMSSSRFDYCVFAPALPHDGRLTIDGRLRLRSEDGSLTEVSGDLSAELRAVGLKPVHRVCRPGDATVLPGPGRGEVLICDASSDSELDRIAILGRSLPGAILWCGSAGLARALACGEPPDPSRVAAPVLAVYGSDSAASLRQIEHAASLGLCGRVVTDGEPRAQAAAISEDLEGPGHCVVSFGLDGGLARGRARDVIAERLRAIVPRIRTPGTLVVTGGETLRSVCSAAQVDHLEVRSQRSPGIPCSVLRGGPWEGVEVVSKSGGFGAPSWLADLLRDASQRRSAVEPLTMTR